MIYKVIPWKRKLVRAAALAGALLVLALVASHVCMELQQGEEEHRMTVVGDAMAPTLLDGDSIVVRPGQEPERFDLVVYHPPLAAEGRMYVGRLIGLGGDRIEIREGSVLLNGSRLEEPYLESWPSESLGPILLGNEDCYVLGDNREHSVDSRTFGAVAEEEVLGVVIEKAD